MAEANQAVISYSLETSIQPFFLLFRWTTFPSLLTFNCSVIIILCVIRQLCNIHISNMKRTRESLTLSLLSLVLHQLKLQKLALPKENTHIYTLSRQVSQPSTDTLGYGAECKCRHEPLGWDGETGRICGHSSGFSLSPVGGLENIVLSPVENSHPYCSRQKQTEKQNSLLFSMLPRILISRTTS